jgi:hypothetical protein
MFLQRRRRININAHFEFIWDINLLGILCFVASSMFPDEIQNVYE